MRDFNLRLILFLFLYPSASSFAQKDSTSFFRRIDSSAAHYFKSKHSFNLMNRTHEFAGTGSDTTYQLPDEFLVKESETIEVGTLRLRRVADYEINYRFGIITFNFLLEKGLSIRVVYQIYPFQMKSEYFHRALVHRPVFDDTLKRSVDRAVVVSNANPDNLFESSQMSGTGSITRGFTVGSNQNFTLNSGLNVQIAGNISDDVTIEASLTDENTPIQPEGNTENLQQIDKVFIEVKKGDRYTATFGDFDVNLSGTEFGTYTRKLQGIRASMHSDNVTADVAFGTAKGKYVSNTLTVIEGVQGPYALTGQNGEKNILIIAGTEKVWLNGVVLTRGENNDYVVDYGAGQMTFTRKRLITAESRMVVDFEYSDDIFNRNSFSAGVRTDWLDKKFSFGGTVLSEYDDKNNPINLSLSDRTIDSLSHIDDSQLAANGNVVYVDGSTKVEFGRGAYLKTFNAVAAESIFVYVGSDSSGDYNVRFTDLGNGHGDYVRGNILGEFVFAGKLQGSFQPLVPLPLPTSTQLVSLFLKAHPSRNFELNGEAALSSYDPNSFSAKTRSGMAYNFKANIQKQKLLFGHSDFGEVDFDGRWRHVDSTFRELNRVNGAEFNRTWNIPGSLFSTQSSFGVREDVHDAALRYRPVEGIQLKGSYGYLQRGDDFFNATRYGGGLNAQLKKLPEISYAIENINSNLISERLHATTVRQQLFSHYQWWKIRPGFDYEDEDVKNKVSSDSAYGTAFQTYRPRLDFNGFKKTQFGVMIERRYDKGSNGRVDSLNGTVSISTTQRYYWNVSDWKDLNSTIEFVQRRRVFQGKFADAENPNKLTKLVSSTVDYYPWHRAAALNVNYQVTDERIQDRKIVFIPVPPNTGNFTQVSPDSFIQVPPGQGDWVQGSVRSDQFTSIVELKFGTRLRIDLFRFFENHKRTDDSVHSDTDRVWQRIVKMLSTETFFQVEENQKQPELSFYFLNLKKFQNDKNTLRGSLLFRQDLFANQAHGLSVRLRYELQKSFSDVLTNGNDRRRREIKNIRIRKQVSTSWAFENEAEYGINRKHSTIHVSGLNSDFSLSAFKTSTLLSYRPKQEIEIINKCVISLSKDKISSASAKAVAYSPEIIYSFKNRGRADIAATITRIYLRTGAAPLPFELTDGHADGWNASWLFSLNYRLSNNTSLAFNYSGRKEPKQSIVHLGSAEFRAFF